MTGRLLLATLAALALLVGACGSAPPPSESSPPDARDPVISPLDLRYKCGEFAFAPGLLAEAGNAEQADNPAAAALRAYLLGTGPDIDFLPGTGWHLTGMNERVAEFIAVDRDSMVTKVGMENRLNGWTVAGWGQCQPRIDLAEGLGAAEWAFDPAQPKPGAATQTFDAMVSELSCSSGQPADGRIVGPGLVKSADTILVIFAVRPRPGGQDCQGTPPIRVKVDLGELLGNRVLLDGGRFPPGDPTQPRF